MPPARSRTPALLTASLAALSLFSTSHNGQGASALTIPAVEKLSEVIWGGLSRLAAESASSGQIGWGAEDSTSVDEDSEYEGEDDELMGKWGKGLEGYSVHRFPLGKVSHLGDKAKRQRRELITQFTHVAEKLNLDIWHSSLTHLDILLPPTLSPSRILSHLPAHTTSKTLISASLLPFLLSPTSQTQSSPNAPVSSLRFKDPLAWNLSSLHAAPSFHDHYHPLSSIRRFQKQLVEEFGEGLVKEVKIGKSAEGRTIWGLQLHINDTAPTNSSTFASASAVGGEDDEGREVTWVKGLRTWAFGRPEVTTRKGRKEKQREEDEREAKKGNELEFFIMGGQHAREWISPATILYLTHSLLLSANASLPIADDEAEDPIIDLLKRFTITLVPMTNPDGYQWTWKGDKGRLWRKNRQDVPGKGCKGIDLNANWGYKWAPLTGINPCSDSYPGDHAFEAVETKSLKKYLEKTNRHVKAFVDLHSYGQLFMFPFSSSCTDFPRDAETLMEAGLGVAKSVKSLHGTSYQAGQACDLVYRSAGDSIDWSYADRGVRFSYSAELRDTGTYGFLLPAHLIRPTAEEMTSGMVYLAEFIRAAEIGPRG